jgi:hypothetical protein
MNSVSTDMARMAQSWPTACTPTCRDRDWRHRPGPGFTLYPVDAAVAKPEVGRVFRKRHTQLLMQWPR